MSSRQFRAEREADWQRLEYLVALAEKGSLRALDPDDLLRLPVLYRACLSALAVARETSLDAALEQYLDNLAARAWFVVNARPVPFWRWLAGFFRHELPAAMRAVGRETVVAALLMLLGGVAGYLLVMADPSWYAALMPDGMAGGRDPGSSAKDLRDTLYDSSKAPLEWLQVFASYLFSNNARVAVLTFALGFALGLPSALLLVVNGASAGALIAVFVKKGLGTALGGWLMIHGSTELFAVAIAGGAGLHVARGMLFPGDDDRGTAAAKAGRTGATAMCGVLLMLVAAAVLEGFARQLVQNDVARYAIGVIAFAGWCSWFYRAGRHG